MTNEITTLIKELENKLSDVISSMEEKAKQDKIKESQNKLYSKQSHFLIDFIEEYFIPCIEDDLNKLDYDKREEVKFFIAGGAVTSSFTKKEINDYDVYFYNAEDIDLFRREIESNAMLITETEKAITFNRSGKIFQVCKLTGTPQEIFNMYDFTINMGAFVCTYNTVKETLKYEFVLDDRFLTDIASRTLSFNKNTLYPISSLFRVGKYRDKGYKITNVELMKIALRISQMNIKTVKDIKEQVGGMSNDIMLEMREQMDKLDNDKEIGCPIDFIQSIADKLPMELMCEPVSLRIGV